MKKIYLIQSLEDGYYKIGLSKHPEKRIQQLQTGNSSKLKLIESFESNYPHQVERALQRKYSYLRKEGEWFELDIQQDVSFLSDCERIEKNIDGLKKDGNVFI